MDPYSLIIHHADHSKSQMLGGNNFCIVSKNLIFRVVHGSLRPQERWQGFMGLGCCVSIQRINSRRRFQSPLPMIMNGSNQMRKVSLSFFIQSTHLSNKVIFLHPVPLHPHI